MALLADFTPAHGSESIELVQTFWHMVAPSGRTVTCALYRTTWGLELRAGYNNGDRLLVQRVFGAHVAEVYAAAWRAAAEVKGFRDVVEADPS
jgi:hypothetical protein